jgi:hypothetical protein
MRYLVLVRVWPRVKRPKRPMGDSFLEEASRRGSCQTDAASPTGAAGRKRATMATGGR